MYVQKHQNIRIQHAGIKGMKNDKANRTNRLKDNYFISGLKEPRQDPIIIAGFPRSGTTLVQANLATQENIVSFPETHFFERVYRVVGRNEEISTKSLGGVIKCINRRSVLSIDAENAIFHLAKKGELTKKFLFEIVVMDNLRSQVPLAYLSEKKWLEKTPYNEHFFEIFHKYYPNAKFIYVVRNPEKCILSKRRYMMQWNRNAGFKPVEVYAEDWQKSLTLAEQFKSNKPEKLIIVKFEQFIKNTEEMMGSICDFLGIKFEPEYLQSRQAVAKLMVLDWEH